MLELYAGLTDRCFNGFSGGHMGFNLGKGRKGFVSRPDSCAMCYELKLTSPTSFFEPLPHEPLMHIYIC